MKLAIRECSQKHFNFQSSSLAPPQRNKALGRRQVTDIGVLLIWISLIVQRFYRYGWGQLSQAPAHKLLSLAGAGRGRGSGWSSHLPRGVGATSHGVVVGGSHPRVRVDGFVQGLLPQLHAKGVQLHRGGHTVCRKTNREHAPAVTGNWDNLNSYCCLTAGENEPNLCYMQYLKWQNSKQNC